MECGYSSSGRKCSLLSDSSVIPTEISRNRCPGDPYSCKRLIAYHEQRLRIFVSVNPRFRDAIIPEDLENIEGLVAA